MFHQEFLELVWEDGRLAMRGFPERTQNNPSSHASNIVHEQNLGPIVSLKKPRFATADSISKNHHLDKEKDLNLNFTRNSSHQDNKDHHESLSELYQTHFDLFRGNSNHDKLPKDSQVVPVNGYADLKTRRVSNYFGEIPQVAAPSNTSQPADSSLQHYQTSAPSKRPRVISRPNLVSLAELANSTLKEHDVEPEGQKETLNFSLFPTSLALPTSSRRFSGAEDLKNNAKTTSGPASNNPFELMLIAPVNGSKGVKGLENRPSPRGTNVEFLTPVANPPDKSLPDAQSEAVPPRDAFTNKISQDQVYDQTSRLPENYAVKGKVNNEISIEPPAASSSFCSRGASNNPTCSFKRTYEEAELSAHLSDENEEEEEERATKTVSARRSKVKRKRPSAEVHNLYERKRRDRINKKMRALQELIPNCNMTDKASLLDEAIEYVKTLQLRVQMMSMGNGMCLPPPMMIPPGMQALRAPQITHFSPMSMGMDMRFPMVAGCNPSQFLIAPIPGATSVPGIAETRFQMPDFPSQPLPMSMLRAPFIGLMHKTLPIPGVSRVAASTERIASASKSNSKDSFHKNVGDNNYKS